LITGLRINDLSGAGCPRFVDRKSCLKGHAKKSAAVLITIPIPAMSPMPIAIDATNAARMIPSARF
jgi:hypothetical protein